MAATQRLICSSHELLEQSRGVRFALPERGEWVTGFVVRYNGHAYAYVNSCAHIPVELDWAEGNFFDLTGHYLICSTHGARYVPGSGYCVMGPCQGKSLQRLEVTERDGNIYLILES